jgi:hypothetical protein
MGIPIGQTYTATVRASTYKPVKCESCSAHYIYKMERQAEGQGNSLLFLDNDGAKQRASDEAEQKVRQKLKDEFDTVPCPKCGCYQEAMAQVVRGRRFAFLRWLGIAAIVVGGIVGLLEVEEAGPFGAFVWAPGIAMIAFRRWESTRRFDPNAKAHERAGWAAPNVALLSKEQYSELVETIRQAA